jgi:hypothetical protein
MINPRRQQRNIPAKYNLSDILNMFRGGPADTPRLRQKLEQIKTGLNIPPVAPMTEPSLLQAQPQELATGLMQMAPTTDITTGQTVNMETLMKPLLSESNTQNNLLTKKEEEKIAKDPEALQKYTRAGNFFSRLGGFQTFSPEQLAGASAEQLDIYNKQRLAARNKGIGEMLLMLSDALGGRDVAMRALERQKLKQPARVKATEAIKQEELAVLQKLKQLETELKEGETIEDLVEKLSMFEQIVYDNFIKKPESQSFIEDFLSGRFNNNTAQQEPIKITKVEEG